MTTATPAAQKFADAAAPSTVLAPAAASPPPTVRQDSPHFTAAGGSAKSAQAHRRTALSTLPAQPNFETEGPHTRYAACAASPAAITPAKAAPSVTAYGTHPASSVGGTPAAAFAHKPLLASTPAGALQQQRSAPTPAGQGRGAHTSPRAGASVAEQAVALQQAAAPAAGTVESCDGGQPGADSARLAPVEPDQIATVTLCSPQPLRIAPVAPVNAPAIQEALPEEAACADPCSIAARSPQAAETSEGPAAVLPEERSLGDAAHFSGESRTAEPPPPSPLACAPPASLSGQTGRPVAAGGSAQLPTPPHHITEAPPPVPASAASPRRSLTRQEAPTSAVLASPPVPALATKLRRLSALLSPDLAEALSAGPEPGPAPVTRRVPAAPPQPLPEAALQAVESDAEAVFTGETTEPRLEAAETAESLPASSSFLLPASPPVPAVAAALRRASLPTTNATSTAPGPELAADQQPPGAQHDSPGAQVSRTLRSSHPSRLEVYNRHGLLVVQERASVAILCNDSNWLVHSFRSSLRTQFSCGHLVLRDFLCKIVRFVF